MGSNAALGVFRVPKSIFFAAQQLDAFLYIQDTDAVAGELGRLLGIVLQHPVDGRFSALIILVKERIKHMKRKVIRYQIRLTGKLLR